MKLKVILPVALLSVSSVGVAAQPFTLDFATVDGGGGASAGGRYLITGTIGQPDAGHSSGGDYTLLGGFWPATLVVQNPEAPTLLITSAGSAIVISWQPASPSFTLHSAENLIMPLWQPVPNGTNGVRLPANGEFGFFTLIRDP